MKKRKRLRVAYIAFDSAEYPIRLASALAQEIDVHLVLPQIELTPHHQWLDAAVHVHAYDRPRFREPLKQMRMIRSLLRCLKQIAPDVIHLHQGHMWFNLALPWLKQYPLVVTIKDPIFHVGDRESRKTPQAIIHFGFKRADQIVVHNQPMKQMAIEACGLREDSISVVPLIERGDGGAQKQVAEEGNQILFFGRIWKYKGLEYLIRAEPLISAQVPDTKIVIAGSGDDFAPYRRMMVHPERFVVHNEFVSYAKRAELFRRASIVVLPYIEATQSGVIPVAYTYEKPVIATSVGGLPEQLEHGHTGFLVPPRDVQALADCAVRLLRDETLRRRLGANGKRKADTEWSANAVAQKILPVYHRAREANKAPS